MNASERNNPVEHGELAEVEREPLRQRKTSLVHRGWQLVPEKYRQNFEPEILAINLLPGEDKQLEIHLAWYRQFISNFVFSYFKWLLLLVLLLTIGLYILTQNRFYAAIPFFAFLLALIEGVREYIEYHQWRLIKTNKRLIISLPQKHSWPLIDNIEMGDLPKIIDSNWSNNWVWKILQFFTGARDIHLSLTAFQFDVNSARVKDALVIPDIMPDDVYKLKELVFSKK